MVPPPPLPDSLHCVKEALVVSATGVHESVGCVPPPSAAELHWFTVAEADGEVPMTLLTMDTVQLTVPPPPLPEPLHCVTEEVSWLDGADHGVQVRAVLAAPWHSVPETEVLTTPVAMSMSLVTVTVHAMACPPTLSTPLHWLTAGAVTPNAAPPDSGPNNTSSAATDITKRRARSVLRMTAMPRPVEARCSATFVVARVNCMVMTAFLRGDGGPRDPRSVQITTTCPPEFHFGAMCVTKVLVCSP
jgi:hypothetical protein